MNLEAPKAVTLSAKRKVLIRNLLQNTAEVGDIPLDSPAVPYALLPFLEITDVEIYNAVLGAGNTAPRKDEIPTLVLKVGWPLIKSLVTTLFHACLELGHHPACF
jgi:hypothetical protein